jgi:signal transduction histidine kinase
MPRAGLSSWKPSGFRLLLSGLAPRTTTARISLMLFLVILAGSALLLILLERATQTQLDREAQARITAIAETAERTWRRNGIEAAVTILDGELAVPGPLIIHLAARDGSLLLGNLARWPASVPSDRRYYRVPAMHNEHGDIEPYMVTARPMPDGYRLLVGRSLEAEVQLQSTLTTLLAVALPVAALLAWLTSKLVVSIITDRARGIADVVGEVTAGKLHARVDLPPGPPADAFDSMGQAFNVMLARVESVLDELRAVTDGLAHDLRSPLTRLKARIDKLQQGSVIDAADLEAVSAEAESLLGMLDTSLELAVQPGLTRVTALAHRQLLGRALANLIDNALRYGATGKRIELAAERHDGGARLVVGDHGPGIPTAQRREALRRFGRLDAARGRQGQRLQGAGLGLSLAAAVARLHGGTLTLADNKPGLQVAIDLPSVAAAE